MEINESMRDEAYTSLTETKRVLYSDPDQGAKLRGIFTHHSLPEELYKDYAITVGDVILGFYKPSDLPVLFENILHLNSLRALRLAADLTDFLAPLSNEKSDGMAGLSTSIAETEAALQHLPSTRTMAGDALVIKEHEVGGESPVYQSTQPNLRPGNPLRGPGAPTWDD